ncbi:MAG: nucleotidyltransferase domain-containing protein [Bacillota bacterium]|nr:nucleotidyltransferase domain-containing protein [Bacillota bacterium]
MTKTILQYQKAFNSITEKLKANKTVLSVMVFGSMVSGDLWEESDIDFFVIVDGEISGIRNIYTKENEVNVHIKLMSKEKFLGLHEKDLRGGFIHRIFASSKLVFSKDMDITMRYNNGRYYPDVDRERWNMVYIGNVLRNVGICKKYLYNESIYTAYSAAIKCLEDYAKLYVNSSGYMISKDAMTMAMNLSDSFKDCVDQLLFNKADIVKAVENTIAYLEDGINTSIKNNSLILLNYMREKDTFLSAEEIKKDKLFEDFDIAFEDILSKLWEKNVVKKDFRDYKLEDGVTLVKENVYYI